MQSLRSRLPPPTSLVAFEAAARHGSFTVAAGELNVTRVAVSTQVKGLEEFLGTALFVRRHRSLRLTVAGQLLAQTLSLALSEVAATIDTIRAPRDENRVTITTSTGFVTYWLLPHIHVFRSLHPEVDLRFLVSDRYLDLEAEGVDIAIRYGDGPWAGNHAIPLVREEIFPVCSPAYLGKRPWPKQPQDLTSETLLHLDGPYDPETRWETWFRAHDVTDAGKPHGIFFNAYTNLVQAALDGQGIALLGPPLLSQPLTDGRLVRPLAVPPTPRRTFWLLFPGQRPVSRATEAFCGWISQHFGKNFRRSDAA